MQSCRPTRAFTLIELLVVIAIIAVLTALMMPALAEVKRSARKAECINRMKQWTLAMTCYTADYQEKLPREGYHSDGDVFRNNWGQVYSAVSADVWYNSLAPYVSRPSAASCSGRRRG